MKAKGIMLLAILGAALVAVPLHVRAQQPDVDRQVQEAKALYRDGSFAEAIVKLQDAISRLQLLRDIEAKRMQLAEAYLHMSLSYFALDNRAAAKETLKGLVRLDRQRRLDPQIYAPPVIALFEEARAEVLLEPVTANATPSVRPSPSAAPKKGGSKAPLIILGAAAAAGGVALAAKGGGGAGSSGTTSVPTPISSPTPTSSPSASGDFVFISSNPAPGSALSVSQNSAALTVTVSVLYAQSGAYTLFLYGQYVGMAGNGCLTGDSVSFTLAAGQAQTVSTTIRVGANTPCPSLPFSIIGLGVRLHEFPRVNFQNLFEKSLAVTYVVNP